MRAYYTYTSSSPNQDGSTRILYEYLDISNDSSSEEKEAVGSSRIPYISNYGIQAGEKITQI